MYNNVGKGMADREASQDHTNLTKFYILVRDSAIEKVEASSPQEGEILRHFASKNKLNKLNNQLNKFSNIVHTSKTIELWLQGMLIHLLGIETLII